MSNPLQNFYNATITQDWSIGPGNFYVSIKPTTSVGRLVVSPSSDTLREIIEYTSTGTDGNGDYVVISARGVGGTTEQTHTVGEKVRMNITAEDWEDMRDDIDSIVAAGAVNGSETERGIFQKATDAQVIAGDDVGDTTAFLVATPSQINLKASKFTDIQTFTTEATELGDDSSRFDITNPSGNTFRYTYDGTGTNPGITDITVPIGSLIQINSDNISFANCGVFIVTGSGANYFEVTNSEGIAENDKNLSNNAGLLVSNIDWTKPSGAKVIEVITQGAGGGAGGGANNTSTTAIDGGAAGGGGAWRREILDASTLSSTVKVMVGKAGVGGAGKSTGSNGDGVRGKTGGASSFGAIINSFGGGGGGTSTSSGGSGGSYLENGYAGEGSDVTGGRPFLFPYIGTSTSALALNYDNIGTGGGRARDESYGGCTEYGGAAGGGHGTQPGGSSIFGGAGGGGGGDTNGAGGNAGKRGSYTAGSGVKGGAIAGGAGIDGINPGDGGSGGGTNAVASGAGGNGGNGNIGGGGGGGGCANNNGGGGNGGNGGRGEVTVITYF